MSILKIIYGIDLGTTNSAITRFENGRAVVKKNALQSDTTPSCVSYNRNGKVSIGARARAQLEKDYVMAAKKEGYKFNTFIEFKRMMGTDYTYESSNIGRNLTPEELSAEVLKDLRKNILDDSVTTAVITVPAMFNNTQKDATKRAAMLAGFDHVELIQEPVAASVAYGLEGKMRNAYWVVFDFGGGTFDAALMRIQDGVMQPIDTAGNNKLGGKDIDQAILEEIIIPYLKDNYQISETLANKGPRFVNMWKAKAEEAKIRLSFEPSYDLETDLGDDFGTDDMGEELALSLTITQEDLERVAAPIYQKAIDITNELLRRNHLTGDSLGALILVGGPTHSPIIRKMLREQVTPNVDTSIDPMTCVAAGAAIYGSTVDVPEEVVDKNRDQSKVQLNVKYPSTSVEEEEWIAVSLLKDKSANLQDDSVMVEFSRQDGRVTTAPTRIDAQGDVVSLPLEINATNVYDIHCYDSRGNRLECEPNQISIIQGITGLGDAVMPMSIGIGTVNEARIEIFVPIPGLEKSRKLPANGDLKGLRFMKDIRPGVEADELRISIYQVDDVPKNMRVLYCQRQYDAIINGEDVPVKVPAQTEVELHFHADQSGTIDKLIVDIPKLGITTDITERLTSSKQSAPSINFISRELADARKRVRELRNEALMNRLNLIEQRVVAERDNREALERLFTDMQALCRDIDEEYSKGAWERELRRVNSMYDELEADNKKYGNAETTSVVARFKAQMEEVKSRKDPALARELYSKMWNYDFDIARVDFYIVWIKNWDRDFNQKLWHNKQRARQLLDNGLSIINNNPTKEKLQPIIDELYRLLPEFDRPDTLGN